MHVVHTVFVWFNISKGIFIYGGCLRIPNDVNKLFESLCDPESDHYFPTKILEGYTTKTAVKAVESEAVYFVAEGIVGVFT